ncbi:unnamed protein product, partial [Hymenolepis diminuta]
PTSLQLKDISLHTTPGLITCDVSTGIPRPFVPKAFRRQVFESLHNLSHHGKRATAKLITDHFVWHLATKTSQIGRRLVKRANDRKLISTLKPHSEDCCTTTIVKVEHVAGLCQYLQL